MADSFGKWVVRTHSPRRRAWLIGAAGMSAVAFFYGMFELGRYDAGYRVVDTLRGVLTSRERVRALQEENARLRSALEGAELARRVDREGYAQIQRNLSDMQSQIARLQQDLSFYRGLVQPATSYAVKVQSMQIVPAGAGSFRLKFVLVQPGKADKAVSGNTFISLDGLMQGKPINMNFAKLSAKRRDGLSYSFRYFQDFDETLTLPGDFVPARINVEIRSGRDASHAIRQAFLWKTQGPSVEAEVKDRSNVQAQSE